MYWDRGGEPQISLGSRVGLGPKFPPKVIEIMQVTSWWAPSLVVNGVKRPLIYKWPKINGISPLKIAENQWVSLGLFHPEISGIIYLHMGVSKNRGTPKSSILIRFSIIFTIHFGGKISPIFGTPISPGFSSRWENPRSSPPTRASSGNGCWAGNDLRRTNKNLRRRAETERDPINRFFLLNMFLRSQNPVKN